MSTSLELEAPFIIGTRPLHDAFAVSCPSRGLETSRFSYKPSTSLTSQSGLLSRLFEMNGGADPSAPPAPASGLPDARILFLFDFKGIHLHLPGIPAPPTYEESVFGKSNVHDDDNDNQYTRLDHQRPICDMGRIVVWQGRGRLGAALPAVRIPCPLCAPLSILSGVPIHIVIAL